jgi:hypothetical protein
MITDFDDAEGALRAAIGSLRGWSFERFQALAGEQTSLVSGASGLSYRFDIDVTDRSGDYDRKDEFLELEFTVSESAQRRVWSGRPYVRAVTLLRRGETFSGDDPEILRRSGRSERTIAAVVACCLAAIGGTLLFRWVR